MKKRIFTIAALSIILSISMNSCGDKNDNSKSEVSTETKYYCPMECEGEKTYSEKGSCPTCGMDLVEK